MPGRCCRHASTDVEQSQCRRSALLIEMQISRRRIGESTDGTTPAYRSIASPERHPHNLAKGIFDGEPASEGLAVLQIFGIKCRASGVQCGGHYQRIVDVVPVHLGNF